MKKIAISLFLVAGLMLLFTPVNWAVIEDVEDFEVTVNIPFATGVSITASQFASSDDAFQGFVTEFDFDPMDFDAGLGVFLPNHYYAVDVGVTGGAGTTDVNFAYSELSTDRPDDQPATGSFGFRSTATFFRVLGGPLPEDQDQQPLPIAHGTNASTQLLKNFFSGGVDIAGSDLNGGFFRVFIGVYPGGDINGVDIASDGGAPFTTSDEPGLYKGTVTITATII